MVLAQAPRSSFPGNRKQPNPRRVVAWSTALALHVVVLAIALAPAVPLPAPPPKPVAKPMEVVPIERVVVAPTPAPAKPTPRSEPVPLPVPTVPAVAPIGRRYAVPAPSRPQLAPSPTPFEPVARPTDAFRGHSQAIAIDTVTPPPYPGIAARRGEQGTVVLRVMIGADGVPRVVEVERGSGSRTLDRAAREHVLAAWRFHPALRDGQPVAAWARVPIEFSLD